MKLINQKIISAGEYSPRFKSGTPFLVEGCMIFQCIKGIASFNLNFHDYDIREGDFVFLFNDMVVELNHRSVDFTIRHVSLTESRTLEVYVSITSQSFWDALYISPVQVFKGVFFEQIENWIKECLFVYNHCSRETSENIIVRQVNSLFIVMEDLIGRSVHDASMQYYGTQWEIAGSFLIALSRNYRLHHKVAFYADSLNITPDYLSVIIRECTGKTPKEVIENKLILAMKALLESTNLPIKTIAERLNYEDTSHLCKVFRRNTGMSPMEYRKTLL